MRLGPRSARKDDRGRRYAWPAPVFWLIKINHLQFPQGRAFRASRVHRLQTRRFAAGDRFNCENVPSGIADLDGQEVTRPTTDNQGVPWVTRNGHALHSVGKEGWMGEPECPSLTTDYGRAASTNSLGQDPEPRAPSGLASNPER